MDDDIKALRDALQAGPTPDEWTADETDIYAIEDCQHHPVASADCNPSCRMLDEQEANAAYIAAANPARIARLLDRLEAAEGRYRWLRFRYGDRRSYASQGAARAILAAATKGAK